MPPSKKAGLLSKAVALVAGGVLLILAFMFSLVLFAVIAVVGIAAWAYFWWKTRELRKAVREHAPRQDAGGQVIDGEAVIVEEDVVRNERILPTDEGRK